MAPYDQPGSEAWTPAPNSGERGLDPEISLMGDLQAAAAAMPEGHLDLGQLNSLAQNVGAYMSESIARARRAGREAATVAGFTDFSYPQMGAALDLVLEKVGANEPQFGAVTAEMLATGKLLGKHPALDWISVPPGSDWRQDLDKSIMRQSLGVVIYHADPRDARRIGDIESVVLPTREASVKLVIDGNMAAGHHDKSGSRYAIPSFLVSTNPR